MFKKIAVAAALAVIASSTYAAETTGFYVGAQVGTSKLDGISGHKSAFGGLVGYDFNDNVAVELGYGRLASFKVSGVDIDADQTIVSVLGKAPLGNGLSAYGRLGYNRLHVDGRYMGFSAGDSENKAVFGVGMAYQFAPNVDGRIELQRPSSDVKLLAIGLNFKF
ncbi:outer membrane beta-barrel protein [Massilia sp. TS11]|uniref:outer membrane beta-barrel protein n=1 Tax=Massilia sp. TS11 TaxID=2908003 RepID=UPI001EDA0DE0|nr:outer membrane beta-barrel protein [Massilia sp. TS11]MCG2584397.1 outer membrane beta-barrel protein [Massilia sp. TS11]